MPSAKASGDHDLEITSEAARNFAERQVHEALDPVARPVGALPSL